MFTPEDNKQLADKGISMQEAERQIRYFKDGIDYVKLLKPAIPGDGIDVFNEHRVDELLNYYDGNKHRFTMLKFIPASGAASRMFKDLFEAYHFLIHNENSADEYFNKHKLIKDFFENLQSYPFYKDLQIELKKSGLDIDEFLSKKNYSKILDILLHEKGLNYGNLPKGLLKFHKYDGDARTAFQEHFEEAALYLADIKDQTRLHFTVSPEHKQLFKELSNRLISLYNETKNLDYKISFSEQKSSTDTISVNLENEPFRVEGGKILFRPGGHGALLENLNDLDEELVFVGNVDNVAPDRLKGIRTKYKKVLGAYLMQKVTIIHDFLRRLDKGEGNLLREQIIDFVREISPLEANLLTTSGRDQFNEKAHKILNRPIRVCGMVKNIGEPGGGPFWIKESSGRESKQIIESSQIDLSEGGQEEIFNLATHFNPVDLVCFIRDYRGNSFNLIEFRDPDMGFISKKSFGGRDLKALELPGLWNGSMAKWISYFADVPLETFSPVKTVFDLLRDEHQ